MCTIVGCGAPTRSRGLCEKHYQRSRAGKTVEHIEHGDESGFGIYGALTEVDGKLLCHECGEFWVSLGRHAVHHHEMSARDYKIKHGLPVSKSIMASPVREKMSEHAKNNRNVMAALEAHRDPAKASAASKSEESRIISASTHSALAPRGPLLKRTLRPASESDMRALTLFEQGVSYAEISRQIGVSPPTAKAAVLRARRNR